jgi:hypothetical protein
MAHAAYIFSSTVSEGNICATSNDREMSRLSKWIVPFVGIVLMKAVLAAPLESITPTVCRGGTLTVMSRAASTSQNCPIKALDGVP